MNSFVKQLIPILLMVNLFWIPSTTRAEEAETIYKADVCIYGATPGGIACAVRSAREGLNVLLVNRTEHLGGMLTSGLGVWDTVWEGKRAPVYDELRENIFEYYRTVYGPDSSQYRDSLPGESGHSNGKFEPHVAEKLIEQLVKEEPKIQILTGYIPVSINKEGRVLKSMTVQNSETNEELVLESPVFVDCSYEGDLLPLAKVSYRVGRESRQELGEPHAGQIHMKSSKKRPASISEKHWKSHERLDLRKFPGFQMIVPTPETGEGDNNVQAMNYRTILSSDPKNRLPVNKTESYDPELLKELEFGSFVYPLPNQKICWNRPQLVGPHQKYVEGDWNERQKVMDDHWEATINLLYYLQNDPTVPEKKREFWQQYGLARDEFSDHDNRPYEIYVREARRLDGRYLLTQHDLMPTKRTVRTPVHADSIAITDWYVDSHAVTTGKINGSLDEGKMMLHAETWPGQIPWRCLLPKEVDNLLVPVCLSSSHLAWCAIRLEPTWMQTGEAAGFAVAIAHRQKIAPAKIDPKELVIALAKNGMLITFFNGMDQLKSDEEKAAFQYFGTRGLFPDYDLDLNAGQRAELVRKWIILTE